MLCDVESVRRMVANFCLLEKVTMKTLVGRDLSVYEISTLCDRLEDISNSICVTLDDACSNIEVHIFNAMASRPPLSDIAPQRN